MKPYTYLERLENTLYSRQDIDIEELRIQLKGLTVLFRANLRFQDHSRLHLLEELKFDERRSLQRLKFRYQYQDMDSNLRFRYDNSPHYPHLATFPSHKHVGNDVIAAEPPDLADVLREIDLILYSRTDEQP
jgi:hypothetical protein